MNLQTFFDEKIKEIRKALVSYVLPSSSAIHTLHASPTLIVKYESPGLGELLTIGKNPNHLRIHGCEPTVSPSSKEELDFAPS
jgi:hypothetical protein